MSVDEQVNAIIAWQKNPLLHPLTCGNDSNHAPLAPHVTADGKVTLMCVDCDYRQNWVPQIVMQAKAMPTTVDELFAQARKAR